MSIKPPDKLFRGRIFGAVNWFQWLWAMGFYKNNRFKLDPKYKDMCEHKMNLIIEEANSLAKILPNHYEYLKKFYGRE
jgi:hypothetical protein